MLFELRTFGRTGGCTRIDRASIDGNSSSCITNTDSYHPLRSQSKLPQTEHNHRCYRSGFVPRVLTCAGAQLHRFTDRAERRARYATVPFALSHRFIFISVPFGQLWGWRRGTGCLWYDGISASSRLLARFRTWAYHLCHSCRTGHRSNHQSWHARLSGNLPILPFKFHSFDVYRVDKNFSHPMNYEWWYFKMLNIEQPVSLAS